jgi:Ca2+/H+ antiporter, TMEM165/GDT1 family
MEALLFSTLAVAIAEIGDKTQLLALLLAARYRRFWPLAAGILVATLANHALAGAFGAWLSAQLPAHVLRWLLAGSFIAVALWTLKPDKLDADDTQLPSARNAFIATTVAFFIAEIGDKTQIATVLLAARYDALLLVVLGTTLGMLIANLPVVALGARFAERLPLRYARWAAALVFFVLGVWVLVAGGDA